MILLMKTAQKTTMRKVSGRQAQALTKHASHIRTDKLQKGASTLSKII
jgi:hypothetical protein